VVYPRRVVAAKDTRPRCLSLSMSYLLAEMWVGVNPIEYAPTCQFTTAILSCPPVLFWPELNSKRAGLLLQS
jgi:hypothetical protein